MIIHGYLEGLKSFCRPLPGNDRDLEAIVAVIGSEKPTGLAVEHLIAGQHEHGQELVAIGFVGFFSCIITADSVIEIMIIRVSLAGRSALGHPIRHVGFILKHHHQFRPVPRLARLAQIPPKSGLFDKIAPAIEKITRGFCGDFRVAFFNRGSAHVA